MELSGGHPVKAAYLSIVAHLQIILRLERNLHPKLREFQNDVRGLLEQLDDSIKTKDGVRQWLQTLEANRKQLGCVQYHRACPYGGDCGDLIDTPENRVLQYIHSQIDACRTDAYKILEVRLEEEKEKNQKEKNQKEKNQKEKNQKENQIKQITPSNPYFIAFI
jgi:hypothetical protein